MLPTAKKIVKRFLQVDGNVQDLVEEYDFIDTFENTSSSDDSAIIVYRYNIYAPSVKCWDSTFVIHAIFSIVTILIFVIICSG